MGRFFFVIKVVCLFLLLGFGDKEKVVLEKCDFLIEIIIILNFGFFFKDIFSLFLFKMV